MTEPDEPAVRAASRRSAAAEPAPRAPTTARRAAGDEPGGGGRPDVVAPREEPTARRRRTTAGSASSGLRTGSDRRHAPGRPHDRPPVRPTGRPVAASAPGAQLVADLAEQLGVGVDGVGVGLGRVELLLGLLVRRDDEEVDDEAP